VGLVAAVPALAGPAAQQLGVARGVYALAGTPHLWISDDQGTLHWGGDTRALSGRAINWSDRREVTLDQLRSFRIGDPWLSAGLIKIGDPIYQAKWETNQDRPTLLHIQSISDVELFGINTSNYGSLVLDQQTWEQRFGMSAATLTRGVLASAVPPAATPSSTASAATVTATPSALKARLVTVNKLDTNVYETVLEVTGAPVSTRLTVQLAYEEFQSQGQSDSTDKGTWGPVDAGSADATGKLTFSDKHGAYKSYTYTFTDVKGNKVAITVGNDKERSY